MHVKAGSVRGRTWVGFGLAGLALLVAGVAMAQPPQGWGRSGLRRNQILRAQYFTAPYQGWYCVRTVDQNGRVQGWRQEDQRRTHVVSGSLGVPGLMSLQAGLTLIGPSAAPPPRTPNGHTRLRMVFQTPAGRARREYANRIPGPVRQAMNLVNSALPGSGGCTF